MVTVLVLAGRYGPGVHRKVSDWLQGKQSSTPQEVLSHTLNLAASEGADGHALTALRAYGDAILRKDAAAAATAMADLALKFDFADQLASLVARVENIPARVLSGTRNQFIEFVQVAVGQRLDEINRILASLANGAEPLEFTLPRPEDLADAGASCTRNDGSPGRAEKLSSPS